jgi:hypothetical protein
MLQSTADPISPEIRVPGLEPGRYEVTAWSTTEARPLGVSAVDADAGGLLVQVPPFSADVALAMRRR